MRRAGTLFVATFLIVLGGLPASAGPAACTFDETTATVTVTSDDPDVKRNNDEIVVDGAPCLDGLVAATVTNTDTIVVEPNLQRLTIDLRGGPFAPGLTDEGDGWSEIEFRIDARPGDAAFAIYVEGTPGDDRLIPATTPDGGDTSSLNLNGFEIPKDPDVQFLTSLAEVLYFLNHGGNDQLLAHGTNDAHYAGGLYFSGGAGDDRMTPGIVEDPRTMFFAGGPGRDVFDASELPVDRPVFLSLAEHGGEAGGRVSLWSVETVVGTDGPDTLLGSIRDERLLGLDGQDLLWGRRGDDTLLGGMGADELDGGRGVDRCDGLPDDIIVRDCERGVMS